MRTPADVVRPRARTDISATLFLSAPHEYDGGELVIAHTQGKTSAYKLETGALLLYPGGRCIK